MIDSSVWQQLINRDAEDEALSARDAAVVLDGIPSGAIALEIGAGVGRLMKRLVPPLSYVCGVDVSPEFVRLSLEYLPSVRTSVLLGDGCILPYFDGSFDFVYSVETFFSMTQKEVRSNLHEAYRVLLPGGTLRVQMVPFCPAGWARSEAGFVDEVLLAGFEITRIARGLLHDKDFWVTARRT